MQIGYKQIEKHEAFTGDISTAVGLVEPERLDAWLRWLGCSEAELWSAIAEVGPLGRDVRVHLEQRQRLQLKAA